MADGVDPRTVSAVAYCRFCGDPVEGIEPATQTFVVQRMYVPELGKYVSILDPDTVVGFVPTPDGRFAFISEDPDNDGSIYAHKRCHEISLGCDPDSDDEDDDDDEDGGEG